MATEPVSFEKDVKPMFRERDRSSMEFAFDLWSLDDVSEYADAILARLKAGTMPCDGAWPRHRSTSSRDGSRAAKRPDPPRPLPRGHQNGLDAVPEEDDGLHLEGVSRTA